MNSPVCQSETEHVLVPIQGTLIQRRDGNENVAYIVNLRSFSLYRNYSYPLTLSNVREPS